MAKTPQRRSSPPVPGPARFSPRFLGPRSSLRGFTEWVYAQPSASLDTVLAPGFFQPADDVLCAGDVILATTGDGAALLWVAPGPGPLRLLPFGTTRT